MVDGTEGEDRVPADEAPRVADAEERETIRVTDKRAASRTEDQQESPDSDSTQDSSEDESDLERRHRDVLNRLTRVQADFANYRRRTESEAKEIATFANQKVAFDILRVLDGFERAFQALPAELRLLSWIDGVALTHAQLYGVLEAQGVKPVDCKPGDPIDTEIHEVVMSEDGEGPMAVAEELQRGYRMHDRLLRPTLVKAAPVDTVLSDSSVSEPAETGAGNGSD